MRLFVVFPILSVMLIVVSSARACNKTTYAGCSADELRAIQQQQFMSRNSSSTNAALYWRDRQYVDRVRSEDRNHELEIERLRAQAAIEVAKQRRRYRYPGGYYIYRQPRNPPVIAQPYAQTYPKPGSPGGYKSAPRPELKGQIYSKGTSYKRVKSAVK